MIVSNEIIEIKMNKIVQSRLIEKVARSIKSLRNKRYWQMLKRLHGGTNPTVKVLQKTHDTGIYHGTTAKASKNILKTKLRPSEQIPGTGAYFGDMPLIKKYYYKAPRSVAPPGDTLLRIKKPSELTGNQLYPNVTNVRRTNTSLDKNFDFKDLMPDNPSIKDLQNLTKIERRQIFFGKKDPLKMFKGQIHISGGLKGNLIKQID